MTGKAGAPIRTLAGGVLAPLDEFGGQAPHRPLAENETWEWDWTVPDEGPLSIIISTSDQRIVVLRNGAEVGRARAVIDDHVGTHVATLHTGKDGMPHWVLTRPIHEATASCCSDGDVAVPD